MIRRRIPLLVFGLLLTALAAYPASQLTFDQSIESLYATDNPRLRDYVESKGLFGGDEFAIVAWTDPDLLEPAGLERIQRMAERLIEVPGVIPASVQDLSDALSFTRFPFLARKRDQILELYRGILIGQDNQTTAVVIRIESERTATVPRGETIRQIRAVADENDLPTYVVGEPVQVHDMFRYVEQDGEVLGLSSSILLILVILILFRSIRWVILPVAVVHITLLWTKGTLALSGVQLSMVSSMLTSLVTIIGVATVIHVMVHFQELNRHLDRTAAAKQAFIDLGPAIFWTTTTTAGGFAAQLSGHIYPVRSFGVMMTLATMLVLGAAVVVLPGGILIGKRPERGPAGPIRITALSRALSQITDWVITYPWRLVAGSVVVLVFTFWGFAFLRVETDFSKNFRESSPIVHSLNFVETHLGGAGSWEVNFPAPQELTPEYLDRVRALTEKLRTLQVGDSNGLTKVLSITDGVDLIPRVPFLVRDLEGQMAVLNRFQPEFISSLYNPEQGRMRIVLRARERQPSENKLEVIHHVERLAYDEFGESKVTGLFVLLTFLIESLLGDQWVSFLLAAVMITGMMSFAFRSITTGLIMIVPNLLPIVIVIGTMGWLGMPINIATAMIASVSMGLTIDSSIHFLTGLQRAEQRGIPFAEALHETHQTVGRALVYANLALVAGFLVLTLSNFIPLVYFGILVSLAMLGGLLGNLILFPLLLRLGFHATPTKVPERAPATVTAQDP